MDDQFRRPPHGVEELVIAYDILVVCRDEAARSLRDTEDDEIDARGWSAELAPPMANG